MDHQSNLYPNSKLYIQHTSKMLKSIHYHQIYPNTFLHPISQHNVLNKLTTLQTLSTTTPTKFRLGVTSDDDYGPVELPPGQGITSIFATNDDPTPLQLSTSVLLTTSISVFLFRAIRLRAKRVKEKRMKSSDSKTMKEDALETIKAIGTISLETNKDPSPVQALLGGLATGVITLILYKFTITIEAALNREMLSDNTIFQLGQIGLIIRTIVNGLCYLATFVFGLNSVGLFLYSAKLTLDSFSEDSTDGYAKIDDNKEENSDTDQTL